MKKLLLLGLVIILFATCQEQKPERYFSSSPEIDITKALLDDYHAGDWTAWSGHYADTAKIHHNSIESATVKETSDVLINILSSVSSYKFDDDSLFYEMIIDDKNEKWVYFWGTWRANLLANNQELIIPVHLALNFSDGKIVNEYAYYDITEFTLALQAIAASEEAEEDSTE